MKRVTWSKQIVCFAAVVAGMLVGLSAQAQADHMPWRASLAVAATEAESSGKPILLKFTADWCVYCKKMEKEILSQPEVIQYVEERFVPVLVDADENKALLKKLEVTTLPTIVVITPDLKRVERLKGYQTADNLRQFLNEITPAAPVAEKLFTEYSLVSLVDQQQLIPGKAEFEISYRGFKVRFTDAAQLTKFSSNPQRYWPSRDGLCPVSMQESGQQVPGKIELAVEYEGRIHFCRDRETALRFVDQPQQFANITAQPEVPVRNVSTNQSLQR